MLSSSATVLRNGERVAINADLLVPGDIAFIKSGDRVPADLRLTSVTNLQVLEAMLTGESLPVSKNLHSVSETAALGDRTCMAFSATTVLQGQGVGVIVATGDNAEIGKINKMVSTVTEMKTNLIIQMEILGRWIAVVVAIVSIVSFLLALLKAQEPFISAFKAAVAIAVAIIPAGLPATVTITLAIGTTIMARNNAIIRQLPCVETLGSLTVICSDKTGTLTKNEMTVVQVRTSSKTIKVTGVGYAPFGNITDEAGDDLNSEEFDHVKSVLEGCMLCNDSTLNTKKSINKDKSERIDYIPQGAPTEVALITAGMKAGLQLPSLQSTKPRIGSVPFESQHKFMATIHNREDANSKPVIYVKGAPDRLIPLCTAQVDATNKTSTAALDKAFWISEQEHMSKEGLRVLAICKAELPDDMDPQSITAAQLMERSKTPFLTMLAMIAILDPPRDEAIAAVKVAHQAGIKVKMITGDHPLTALAIGGMLGLHGVTAAGGVVYTGPQVDAMSDNELEDVVLGCNVFARASPENKLRIVRALQAKGQIAAMTGDGVNDAPALKAANVGVAMGITGTDVTKEASKMVLADDNFASIVAAVKEGRRVWDNLKKIVLFNLPVNFAQGGCILLAYIIGLPEIPMTAVQILYINLATSVTMGLMLATEPPEKDIMHRPPRKPTKKLLDKLMLWRVFFDTTLLIIVVDSMFYWSGLLGYNLAQQRAEAFNVLVFGEIGYSITTRFIKQPSYHPSTFNTNPIVYAAIGSTVAFQLFLTYTPFVNTFFSMEGMDGYQWIRVLVCMVVIYIVVEFEKAVLDPILMPLVARPFLKVAGRLTPAWLRPSTLRNDEMEKIKKDHDAHEHGDREGGGNGEARPTVVVEDGGVAKKEELSTHDEGWMV
jgi:potassium/sodium efflux P-type ATPase